MVLPKNKLYILCLNLKGLQIYNKQFFPSNNETGSKFHIFVQVIHSLNELFFLVELSEQIIYEIRPVHFALLLANSRITFSLMYFCIVIF